MTVIAKKKKTLQFSEHVLYITLSWINLNFLLGLWIYSKTSLLPLPFYYFYYSQLEAGIDAH